MNAWPVSNGMRLLRRCVVGKQARKALCISKTQKACETLRKQHIDKSADCCYF